MIKNPIRLIVINSLFRTCARLQSGNRFIQKIGIFSWLEFDWFKKGWSIGTCEFLTGCERSANIPLLPWRNATDSETEAPPTETETGISSRSRVRLTDTEVPLWRQPLWISAVLFSKQTHTHTHLLNMGFLLTKMLAVFGDRGEFVIIFISLN